MNILISNNSIIPAVHYGGTERVIWDLGKELANKRHNVTFLVREGSTCDFARIIPVDRSKTIREQVPDDIDVIHFNGDIDQTVDKPYLNTLHGNHPDPDFQMDKNTVFVSRNHAELYGSDSFVHNGLDWNNYPEPDLDAPRSFFHFLGKAAWRKKNVKGAIRIARMANEKLKVLGGTRLNFKMGFRYTPYPSISFEGMVDNQRKSELMNQSKGLIFPVRWQEPFGLALTESLYFGCPVFGTPYGSLPEIINQDVGFLSTSSSELAAAVSDAGRFSRTACHDYARDVFNANAMTKAYMERYEKVLNGEHLNSEPPQLIKEQTEKFLDFN
ncbi:hypothetical protein PDESU_04181 [Pontiella desulfatans]|uniref:Glycosyl transferase family 1 domain-containing protein n=1 Tax=Pontiella desulfatans TaxID=2750659 RepID=A0A6C2U863_PONDE|nr:glycosyltransferase [Pontiella desulfatans]VGO15596.1 hypothetical protein PDESU_04181 [Pontiella desulfatans]